MRNVAADIVLISLAMYLFLFVSFLKTDAKFQNFFATL